MIAAIRVVGVRECPARTTGGTLGAATTLIGANAISNVLVWVSRTGSTSSPIPANSP